MNKLTKAAPKSALTAKASIEQWSVRLVRERTRTYVRTRVSGVEDTTKLLSFMSELPEEHFYCVYLNAKHEPIGLTLVSKGTVSASLVHPREVFKGAILANAYAIIVAHNHPSGDTTPSPEDIQVTKQLIQASDCLGVHLLDHLIIGNDTYSFRSEKGHLW